MRLLRSLCAGIALIFLCGAGYPPPPKPKIAIVIDDLGYQFESGSELAELPYPITLAVIPDLPYSEEIVRLALQRFHEVILHVPMEPLNRSHWEEGLDTTMSREELSLELGGILDRYPQVTGINNHGGSKFTADRMRMDWVMEELAPRQLYYFDSRTTAKSVAIEAANAFAIPNSERDVFLDNSTNPESIQQEFERLREIAREHGRAIAIGHPHAETMIELRKQLPLLLAEGFELTYLHRMLNPETSIALASEKLTRSREKMN